MYFAGGSRDGKLLDWLYWKTSVDLNSVTNVYDYSRNAAKTRMGNAKYVKMQCVINFASGHGAKLSMYKWHGHIFLMCITNHQCPGC